MKLKFNKTLSILLTSSLCCHCYNQKWSAVPPAHIDKIETSEHDAAKSVGIFLGFAAATFLILFFFLMPIETGITYTFGGPCS